MIRATISEENSHPGTDSWKIDWPAPSRDTSGSGRYARVLEGYASASSYRPGEVLRCFVSHYSPTFRIDIYRMGYYGGLGGRLMHSATGQYSGIQPLPPIPPTGSSDPIKLIECNWLLPFEFQIPGDWCQGVYLAKLTEEGTTTLYEQYILFVIRDDERRPILLQASVTTYQAYNEWGGRSLYQTALYDNNVHERSRKVSFQRPYWGAEGPGTYQSHGASQFLAWEYPMIHWLESHGYDLSYATSLDVHDIPGLISGCSVFLSIGHDEYWSYEMRENLESALAKGTSVMFLGANPIYWQIRIETEGTAKRVVCFKSDVEDTEPDLDRRTVTWRDLGRSEAQILGVAYISHFNPEPAYRDLRLVNTGSWVYEGVDLPPGAQEIVLEGLLGYEFDRIYDGQSPVGLEVIADTPVPPGTHAGGGDEFAHAVLHWRQAGNGVFAAGTCNWVWGLVNAPQFIPERPKVGAVQDQGGFTSSVIKGMTANILNRFLNASRGRALTLDLSDSDPRVRYWENTAASSLLGGWLDPGDMTLVGDFRNLGYDQVLFINRGGNGGRVLIADFSQGQPPAQDLYWENWGASSLLNGWHDEDDLALVGDFRGLGYDQVLFINRGGNGGRVLIADFSQGPPATDRYWESWGDNTVLDGWHQSDGIALVGRFTPYQRDQVLFINRSGGGGRAMIADFYGGPPASVMYLEYWGQSTLLSGWTDSQDLALAGDFRGFGFDQVLFINRGGNGGRVLIADFSHGMPAIEHYWEPWGASTLLDAWHDEDDIVLAGDFRGLGHDQVLFLNRGSGEGRVLIADFIQGLPPALPLYRENWGRHGELDLWPGTGDQVLAGKFVTSGPSLLMFLRGAS